MNIYLAATYGQMIEMREVAEKLKAAGHTVTSRWINGDEEGMSRERAALMDIADIDYADTIMAFTLPPHTAHTGGGRHVEFGYAFATGKRLIIVGEKGEHVFHYLPNVEHFNALDEAIKGL
jgi:nucleoside 2-deoxyribosyltransferase